MCVTTTHTLRVTVEPGAASGASPPSTLQRTQWTTLCYPLPTCGQPRLDAACSAHLCGPARDEAPRDDQASDRPYLWAVGRSDRQPQREPGAHTRRTRHRDRAVVGLDHRLHYTQA